MTQIEIIKKLISEITNDHAELYLDIAKSIILSRRFPFGYDVGTEIEPQYLYLQIRMAIELYNKRGAEGEKGHSAGGINRIYENADVSLSLLSEIVPKVKAGL